MLQGRVSAALIFIGSQQTGLVPVNDEVIEDLKSNHPPSVEPVLESLIKGPLPRVLSQEVIFENIDGNLIYNISARRIRQGQKGHQEQTLRYGNFYLVLNSSKLSLRNSAKLLLS